MLLLLPLFSVIDVVLGEESMLPVSRSAVSPNPDHPRIYFANIDTKYSGPKTDVVNGWEHLGNLLSPDDGIWQSNWPGEILALCAVHALVIAIAGCVDHPSF